MNAAGSCACCVHVQRYMSFVWNESFLCSEGSIFKSIVLLGIQIEIKIEIVGVHVHPYLYYCVVTAIIPFLFIKSKTIRLKIQQKSAEGQPPADEIQE